MIEDFKHNAAIHGIKLDDKDKGTSNMDVRNVSAEDWSKTAAMINGMNNYKG